MLKTTLLLSNKKYSTISDKIIPNTSIKNKGESLHSKQAIILE